MFLLRQSSLDDVAIHPVCNYTQYDQPDQLGAPMSMDPEHPTTLTSHTVPEGDSDGSGMSSTNPVDLSIPLPSTLEWEWCVSHEVQSLALKEAQLRLAQANESIHKICLSLGVRRFLLMPDLGQCGGAGDEKRSDSLDDFPRVVGTR